MMFWVFSPSHNDLGYCMIESGGPLSRTYANSGALETRGRKRKAHKWAGTGGRCDITRWRSWFRRKGALVWDQLATEYGAEVCGRTMHRIMSDALEYGKHLACMKGWLLDRAKAHRQAWATVMYPQEIPEAWRLALCTFQWWSTFWIWAWRTATNYSAPRSTLSSWLYSASATSSKWKERSETQTLLGCGGIQLQVGHYLLRCTSQQERQTLPIESTSTLFSSRLLNPWITAGEDFFPEEDGDSGHGPKKNPRAHMERTEWSWKLFQLCAVTWFVCHWGLLGNPQNIHT